MDVGTLSLLFVPPAEGGGMEINMEDVLKGNLLKNVITRIDYNDQYELSNFSLKDISKKCRNNGLDLSVVRHLKADEDFGLDDPVTLRNIPIEYVNKAECHCFFDKEASFIIEINNFFFRAIQLVNKDTYTKYEESHLNFVNELFELLKIEEEDIQRISIQKVDEVFFSSIEKMKEVIKPEIVQSNIFGEKQSWDMPSSGSSIVQNCIFDSQKVNFKRIIDRVQLRTICNNKLENIRAYRLYMGYEVYSRQYDRERTMKDNLLKIDKVTKDMFLETFTNEGREKIRKGETIGDVEYNEVL